ncbi:NifB/NifX family molybdenum-iron cluster-binding protein [Candidatus Bipolaricaulota bacterium]|nr:NifB/NifX family molybdenum-iron cluster-binding protein [Candidatus Bipolaricaulota bacterium]
MTRICIPTEGAGGLDASVGEHFGRVPTFTILDTESGDVRIVPNTSEHMGGQGLPADLLANMGIDVVLCQGLGRRAIDILSQRGIRVSIGFGGSAKEAIDAWKQGKASPVGEESACQQHAFHDHENIDGHGRER